MNVQEAARLKRLKKENERLREALDKYSDHLAFCSYWQHDDAEKPASCSCGYREAVQQSALEAGRQGEI